MTKISLRTRIITGYVILVAVIGSMTAILVYERWRMRAIEKKASEVHNASRLVGDSYIGITRLALTGESVIGWDEADLRGYHRQRMAADSLLQALEPHCREYVRDGQIDTLRSLLADKEDHLRHIMEAIRRQDEADSLIVNRLPEVARRATRIRTVRQKKSGVAGLFGGKKSVQVLPSAKELHAFSDSLVTLQQEQAARMDACTDSLRIRNLSLNVELGRLIHDIDLRTRAAFQQREQEIAKAQALSAGLFTATTSAAIILLLLSSLAIHREMKRNAGEKKRREKLILELRQSNEENERLARSRRNLIQNVTHELRTPLASIAGNAELLLADREQDSRIRHTRAISEAAGRMAGMVNNLLTFFRLDSRKETLDIRPFRPALIADTLEAEFAPLAEGKRLAFKVDNRADGIAGGDRNRILSIGVNLLSNAIKFTKSGSVMLTTGYTGGIFTLAVEDTGTGMTEEQLARIFLPFERLGNAATQDGFGLGLAIVADTVKLMDGDISVKSVPGRGSRFTVTIPVDSSVEATETEGKAQPRPVLSGLRVLAMDNDGMLLDLIQEMYRLNGVACDTCQTVDGLTERMRTESYDLLVTDLKMPETDGYEVLELLRTSEIGNSRTIPVVAATAAGYVTEDELKEKGFAALLSKPYSMDELLAVTEKCIKTKEAGSIDLSPLTAFGDKRRTLEKLADTTRTDMEGLRKVAEAGDCEALDGLVHHLRSSWMLIRAERPLMILYEAIHKEHISDEEVQSAVNAVLAQGDVIIDTAGKEAERWAE